MLQLDFCSNTKKDDVQNIIRVKQMCLVCYPVVLRSELLFWMKQITFLLIIPINFFAKNLRHCQEYSGKI